MHSQINVQAILDVISGMSLQPLETLLTLCVEPWSLVVGDCGESGE